MAAITSSPASTAHFDQQGYEIVPGFVSTDRLEQLRQQARRDLQTLKEPIEYEADVGYPGAPLNRDAPGGSTARRLLMASLRDPQWRKLATMPLLAHRLGQLMAEAPVLSQSHHNCVMTKHPGFSSETHWHQDIRYWSFQRPDLISAWFALTGENDTNGALQLIPGSHKLDLDRDRFDEHLFLRPELTVNKPLIDSAIQVQLNPGDLLLFHCRTLHAAGKNDTDQVKLSAVFTYSGVSNKPHPGTKSSKYPAIPL